MASADLDYILTQLSKFKGVVSKPMFGGHGLYQDGVFFGLINRSGVLFFHTDDDSRSAFLEAESTAFEMGQKPGKPARYWSVPEEILEQPRKLAEWAEVACESSREYRRPKKAKRKGKGAAKRAIEKVVSASDRISSLRNLGPATERWLNKVEIQNRGDLESIGSLAAYVAVLKAGCKPSMNLLWALEGALLDMDSRKLPPPVKDSLLERLERLDSNS